MIKFTAEQVVQAAVPLAGDGTGNVAKVTFGPFSRWCATLARTRFGEAWVFIADAFDPDPVWPLLPAIVRQCRPDEVGAVAAALVAQTYPDECRGVID